MIEVPQTAIYDLLKLLLLLCLGGVVYLLLWKEQR